MVRWLSSLYRDLFRRRHLEEDLSAELESCVEMLTEENIREGLAPREARRQARLALGGVAQVKEKVRDVWAGTLLRDLGRDLLYALRVLARSPGFTTVAVLSLALVIGANATVFSVLNPILFHALPYKDPGRLAVVREVAEKSPGYWRDPSLFTSMEWSHRADCFEETAFVTPYPQGITLSARGQSEPGFFGRATPSFFPMLGVEPQLGRTFLPDDPSREAGEPVLLTDSYWRRRFGADPGVLGEQMLVAGQPSTIVGVLPPGFQFETFPGRRSDVWQSAGGPFLGMAPESRWFVFVARLKPGISSEQAQLELKAISRHLETSELASKEQWDVQVRLLPGIFLDFWESSMSLLFGIGLLVLTIGCANVANLLLARARRREKEISIRVALGASRRRIVRQVLTESILLACLGGLAGLFLTVWGIDLFLAMAPEWWRASQQSLIRIDLRVVAFTCGLSVLTGLIFGLAPAFRTARPDLAGSLKEGGRRSTGSPQTRLRHLLVISEVSLALLMLLCAGLMVRSFLKIQGNQLGYDPRQVLTMQVQLQGKDYWGREKQDTRSLKPRVDLFWDELLQRSKNLPGVDSAALASFYGHGVGFQIVGQETSIPAQIPAVLHHEVSSGYFATLGVPMLKGRTVAETDTAETQWVAVLNESMARRFFGEQDPLGQLIQLSSLGGRAGEKITSESHIREVVGIVADYRPWGPAQEPPPTVFVPLRQHMWDFPSHGAAASVIRRDLFLRTRSKPLALKPALERVLADIDPDQAPYFIRPQEELVLESVEHWRFWMRLFICFAAVALLLVVVGVFGVIASAVNERTHEMGVRMALRAQRANIFALVIRQGVKVTSVGLVIGIVLGLALDLLLGDRILPLYGVEATDPLTYALASLLLIVVTLAACYFPDRRATRVDPLVAVKYE